jgi:hypothetical protein
MSLYFTPTPIQRWRQLLIVLLYLLLILGSPALFIMGVGVKMPKKSKKRVHPL